MPLLSGRTQHFTTLGRVAHKYNLQLKTAECWHVFLYIDWSSFYIFFLSTWNNLYTFKLQPSWFL